MSKNRNGKIELLRFIMAAIIVIHHSGRIEGRGNIFPRGSLAVEFFFLISGYFLAAHCGKLQAVKCNDVGRETMTFILNKIRPFYLMMIIAEIFALFINLIICSDGAFGKIIGAVNEVLLLNMTGHRLYAFNVIWYISAMIISMFVIFPICRKYFSVFVNVIAPVSGVLILGALYIAYGSQTGPNEVVAGFIYRGLLRGFAELCMGVFAFNIVCMLRAYNFSKIGYALLTILEIILYVVSIYFMTRSNTAYDLFVFYILFFAVIISFCNDGSWNKMFNHRICYRLGKYSLALYLGHVYWADLINVLPIQNWNIKFILFIICAALFALILEFVAELCKIGLKKFGNLLLDS